MSETCPECKTIIYPSMNPNKDHNEDGKQMLSHWCPVCNVFYDYYDGGYCKVV